MSTVFPIYLPTALAHCLEYSEPRSAGRFWSGLHEYNGPKKGDKCAICLEPLTERSKKNETIKGNDSCSHVFHQECVRLWSETRSFEKGSANCPECRAHFFFHDFVISEANKTTRFVQQIHASFDYVPLPPLLRQVDYMKLKKYLLIAAHATLTSTRRIFVARPDKAFDTINQFLYPYATTPGHREIVRILLLAAVPFNKQTITTQQLKHLLLANAGLRAQIALKAMRSDEASRFASWIVENGVNLYTWAWEYGLDD